MAEQLRKETVFHSQTGLTNFPNQITFRTTPTPKLKEEDDAFLLDIPDFMVSQLIAFDTGNTTGKTNGKTAACKGNLGRLTYKSMRAGGRGTG